MGAADSTRISIKLGAGRIVTRRFYTYDDVASLFAYVKTQLQEEENKNFDLIATFPTRSLMECGFDSSLSEASLLGSQVVLKWLS